MVKKFSQQPMGFGKQESKALRSANQASEESNRLVDSQKLAKLAKNTGLSDQELWKRALARKSGLSAEQRRITSEFLNGYSGEENTRYLIRPADLTLQGSYQVLTDPRIRDTVDRISGLDGLTFQVSPELLNRAIAKAGVDPNSGPAQLAQASIQANVNALMGRMGFANIMATCMIGSMEIYEGLSSVFSSDGRLNLKVARKLDREQRISLITYVNHELGVYTVTANLLLRYLAYRYKTAREEGLQGLLPVEQLPDLFNFYVDNYSLERLRLAINACVDYMSMYRLVTNSGLRVKKFERYLKEGNIIFRAIYKEELGGKANPTLSDLRISELSRIGEMIRDWYGASSANQQESTEKGIQEVNEAIQKYLEPGGGSMMMSQVMAYISHLLKGLGVTLPTWDISRDSMQSVDVFYQDLFRMPAEYEVFLDKKAAKQRTVGQQTREAQSKTFLLKNLSSDLHTQFLNLDQGTLTNLKHASEAKHYSADIKRILEELVRIKPAYSNLELNKNIVSDLFFGILNAQSVSILDARNTIANRWFDLPMLLSYYDSKVPGGLSHLQTILADVIESETVSDVTLEIFKDLESNFKIPLVLLDPELRIIPHRNATRLLADIRKPQS